MTSKGVLLCALLSLLLTGPLVAEPTEQVFTDLDGQEHRLEDFQGKWVVVNYWATWCPPCLEEIPELVQFHESRKDRDAVVVGISMEETPPAVLSRFVDDNLITYPVVPMSDEAPLVGAVPGLPTTYLLDPAGRPVAMQVGQVTAEMLDNYISNGAPSPVSD
ncbi:MAG: TlpA family protein disulfide reductase [Pseudomonadota bacterium]